MNEEWTISQECGKEKNIGRKLAERIFNDEKLLNIKVEESEEYIEYISELINTEINEIEKKWFKNGYDKGCLSGYTRALNDNLPKKTGRFA